MKKLIIAAAIVCAAAMSQAASFKWMASSVKDITGATTYSGAAVLYIYDAGTTDLVGTYNGTMSNGSMGTSCIIGGDEIVQGNLYDAYYKMTDSEGNIFTSSTKTRIKATAPSNATLAFGSSGTWVAAPEPTSAMLLLLGMAGLALKRKQK